MRYELRYSDEAVVQLKGLRAFERAAVIDRIETVLSVNPTLESRVSIKLSDSLHRPKIGFASGTFACTTTCRSWSCRSSKS